MKTFIKLLCFLSLLISFQAGPIVYGYPSGSSKDNTVISPPKKIQSLIEKYYRTYATRDLNGYLGTLYVNNNTARWRAKSGFESTSKIIRIQQPIIHFDIARRIKDSVHAVARFAVDYRLGMVATGEDFPKHEENFALLNLVSQTWKIRKIVGVDEIKETPKGLNEEARKTWEQDQNRITMLFGPPSSTVSPGLLLSYDFTQPPPADISKDLSDHGYTAQLHGPTRAGSTGLYFDGKDDFITVQGGEKLHAESTLTIIGDFTTTGYPGKVWQNIVWKGNAPDCTLNCENREFSLWLNQGAYLHAGSTSKEGVGKGQTLTSSPGGSVQGRTPFALVIDASRKSLKIYIAGKEAASQIYSAIGIRLSDGPLLIGGGGPVRSDYTFRGYMRWLRIYNRALTQVDIAKIIKQHEPTKAKPWRQVYSPDDIIVKSGPGYVAPIQTDPYFAKLNRQQMEPGIEIKDGWFSHPANNQETEIIYRHDGSPLHLKGHATILDCMGACGTDGQVQMLIRTDGDSIWTSGEIYQQGGGKDFDVDLTGAHEIRLVTNDGGNGTSHDWAAWLNLKLDWTNPGSTTVVQQPEPKISGPSKTTGSVESVYILNQKPNGTNMVSLTRFPATTKTIFVWFLYQDLAAGDVLTGVWSDIGRQNQLREIPVVVVKKQGAAGFVLQRPVEGWPQGHYLVAIKQGDNTLNTAQFSIDP